MADSDGAPDMGDLLSALARCLQLAQSSRDSAKSIKHLERGLALCAGREKEHPALAVEAARLRINLGAWLSRAGRHIDALTAVVEAHRALEKILDWAGACGCDGGAAVIAEEAAMLHCAALVAEGIETEALTEEGRNDDLFSEARSLAEQRLAPRHPMVSLTKRFMALPDPADQPIVRRPGPVKPFSPAGEGHKTVDIEPESLSHQLEEGMTAGMAAGVAAAMVPGCRPSKGEKPKERAVTEERPKRAASSGGRGGLFGKPKSEHHDIFAEFLSEDKMERELGKGGQGESRQDDLRKRLAELNRFERLRSLAGPSDLHDVKYSKIGHKMTMKAMTKVNGSRSEPLLLKESKATGQSPETLQVRQLRGLLGEKLEGRRRKRSLGTEQLRLQSPHSA